MSQVAIQKQKIELLELNLRDAKIILGYLEAQAALPRVGKKTVRNTCGYKNHYTEAQHAQCKKLHNQNVSYREIEARTGIKMGSIHTVVTSPW